MGAFAPGASPVLAEGVLLISPGSRGASFPGLKCFGASMGPFSASPVRSKRGCGWERFQEQGAGMPALRVHPFRPELLREGCVLAVSLFQHRGNGQGAFKGLLGHP